MSTSLVRLGFPSSRRQTGTERATMTNRWTIKALNLSALALVGLLAVGCSGDDDDDQKPKERR